MYASDLAKTINAPIFHVNADSMEDVHYVFKIAAQYRQIYKHDVVIDLIGYRKMGHNELDQPSFT
jgi:2-oxoglutarate dehydrogenase E1 component